MDSLSVACLELSCSYKTKDKKLTEINGGCDEIGTECIKIFVQLCEI